MKYRTISKEISVKQNVKKSIFIGSISRVDSIEEAKAFIAKISERYKDANHNTFAYRIGIKAEEFLFSDDGEPSKTAGLPIYNAIRSTELTNVVIVVTRYFGGVKLGISGLIKAYGNTAKFARESAGVETATIKKKLFIELPYTDTQLLLHYINKFKANILKQDFQKTVTFEIEVDEDLFEEFSHSISSRSDNLKIKEI
jgi:uncharacterized YigZ family protein